MMKPSKSVKESIFKYRLLCHVNYSEQLALYCCVVVSPYTILSIFFTNSILGRYRVFAEPIFRQARELHLPLLAAVLH